MDLCDNTLWGLSLCWVALGWVLGPGVIVLGLYGYLYWGLRPRRPKK